MALSSLFRVLCGAPVLFAGTSAALAEAQAPQNEESRSVVASYEGGAITRKDLEAVIAIKLPNQRTRIAQPGGRERLLAELVDYELLALEAERRGYGSRPAVVQATRERMVQAMVEKQLAVDAAKVPADQVKAAYEAEAKRFKSPSMRRARHVLFATEAEADELLAQLKSEARNAMTAIGKVARERSLDQASKRQSGDLGFFTQAGERLDATTRVPVELAKAAFALKTPGELAPKPVRTSEGYSVLLLIAARDAIDVSLKEADAELRGTLASKATKAATDALADSLAKAHPNETHPERVAAIQLDPPPNQGIPQGVPAAPPDPREPPRVQEPDGI